MMNSHITIHRHYSLLNFLIICILLQIMNSEWYFYHFAWKFEIFDYLCRINIKIKRYG